MATKKNDEGTSSILPYSSANINPQPKFYKIIFTPHEFSRLSIPEEFVSRYCKNIKSHAYLSVPDGEVWDVEVDHSEGQLWLAKGLQDFSDYYSINCGHFLVFGYNGRAQFNVTIFDLSATEIEYPNSTHTIESDESIEILEVNPRRHRGKANISEHSVKNIGHCAFGQSSESKRQVGETEDDVLVDLLQDDVASPSFTKKCHKSSEGCWMDKQQSKIVYAKNKRDRERTIAYQRAKAFKSKNPFIILFMRPSYVISRFELSIPVAFARMYFRGDCSSLVLRIPGKGSWSVKLYRGTSQTRFRYGWKAFVLDNKLKLSDVCIFEVIKGTRFFIDVTIFRAAESTQMQKIIGEVPVSSSYKNKIIITDNFVPYSQPKVDRTKNLKQRRGGSYGYTSKHKEEPGDVTELEHSVEILDHCPLGQGSKRKGPERESKYDVLVAMHTKRNDRSCKVQKQQSKNKALADKSMSIAYQRAKDFKSKNPFLILFMQPSYVSALYNLFVPLKFAREYLLNNMGDVVLRVPGGGSWSLKCILATFNAKIFWKAFVLDNKLRIGDVCVFEVINRRKALIDVTIFPAAREVPESSNGTGMEHSVEFLDNCRIGQGIKRKKLEADADDDVSDDAHTVSIKAEKSSFRRKTRSKKFM